ncbi:MULTISPECIES: TetR/AcrR family transcriptional regulator [Streptomyces]|uniref:TetR/AcrR family transcriptional regulator n=1 Tax=Streptomyces lutosisoli TaxID=2665721 RepID=A0ABW2VBX8_9ACTN|nr:MULTISPECIES: TetR/AcrR family transcriptional regulator [unclassified Streptomyces]WSP74810.1 TetR/AcrR family transcriptional regulator [Streptomyces sp. NBC_01236]WTI35672.1 TetR/AcrR family transcriptional regulator [Streptomyces sp. NBC_00775]WUB30654.1 TetR/AcrR family transcriptional regulator [Streptomyces sp. NBC_00589]
MTAVPEEPAWRQRAVERSTRAAKLRAEQRVQRFLDSAQELIAEKGTTDFTVQEVVDRSKQSLRSFYQHFDGKHELLLALFEDALSTSAAEIREAASGMSDPLESLRLAVDMLYRQSHPSPGVQRPLFSDFALQLLVKHPAQVATAHIPLLTLFTELIEQAAEAGAIPAGRPRRQASLVMQTIMFAAQAHGVPADSHSHPVTAEEIWQFCLGGISGVPATAGRSAAG